MVLKQKTGDVYGKTPPAICINAHGLGVRLYSIRTINRKDFVQVLL